MDVACQGVENGSGIIESTTLDPISPISYRIWSHALQELKTVKPAVGRHCQPSGRAVRKLKRCHMCLLLQCPIGKIGGSDPDPASGSYLLTHLSAKVLEAQRRSMYET